MTDLEKSLEQERWLAVGELEDAQKELRDLRRRCGRLYDRLAKHLNFRQELHLEKLDADTIFCELADLAKGE